MPLPDGLSTLKVLCSVLLGINVEIELLVISVFNISVGVVSGNDYGVLFHEVL